VIDDYKYVLYITDWLLINSMVLRHDLSKAVICIKKIKCMHSFIDIWERTGYSGRQHTKTLASCRWSILQEKYLTQWVTHFNRSSYPPVHC